VAGGGRTNAGAALSMAHTARRALPIGFGAVLFACVLVPLHGQAPAPAPPARPAGQAATPAPVAALTAKDSAPLDLTGYWVSVVTEDWRYRMVMPRKG